MASGLDPDQKEWLSEAELLKLEADPGAWLRYFWPDRFGRAFTAYQVNFLNFFRDMKAGTTVRQPRVECEPRGVGKSTIGRAGVVYLMARRIKHYALYVSATDNQAKKHFAAIRKMMESPRLLQYYPHLLPQVSAHRNATTNWSAERLVTDAGQVVEFISVLGNARGFNSEEGRRLDLIVLDDIDDQKDSVDTTEKKLDIIGSNIVAAGDDTTDVIYLQNLIIRTSICTRLRDNTAGILVNRHFVGPFPLCRKYAYVEEKIKGDTTGAKTYRLTDFQPFDPATSREYAQRLLTQLGPKIFERECQQNLTIIDDDKDFREYSEIHHVITYSEFYNYWKRRGVPIYNERVRRLQIPPQWNVGLGQDWGTTPEHPASIAPVARPNQNVPLHDSFFVFGEVVLPKYPHDPNQPAEDVSPGRVAAAEKAHLKKWSVTETMVTIRRMSHEASSALNSYKLDMPEELKVFYNKWKAARGSGVPQMQNVLEIDYTERHPFRRYPKLHPKAGQAIMGRPRIFIVVPDDQGRLMTDDAGQLYVSQPFNQDGCARLRREIPVYSHLNTGPTKKIFDDMVDAIRGLMGEFVILSAGKTDDERYRDHLKKNQPELLKENIMALANDEAKSLTLAREQHVRQQFQDEIDKGKFVHDETAEYFREVEDNDSSIFDVEDFVEL